MTNTTVIIIQNNHTYATEFLIIMSQTVFFLLIFLILKHGLIDRRGMMHDYNRILEERLQLGAIFFAIIVFIALLMIPLESYEFGHFVIPITYIIIVGVIIWEILLKRNGKSLPGPGPIKTVTGNVSKPIPIVLSSDIGNYNPFGRTNTTCDY